jgi:DNA-binding XRE family transcriptional regulator
MPAKPIFTDEQYDQLRATARRVWKSKFESEGQTQKQMAFALGISQQSVSNLLKGTYRPGLKVATEIATLDGKELEEVIGDYTAPTHHHYNGVNMGPSTFAGLDVCIQFHASSKHWSPWTIAAARAGFFGPTDYPAPEWTGKLDLLERTLDKVRKAL